MAQNDDKKRQARKRYVFDRQAVPTIAVTIGVTARTIQRWKHEAKTGGDDWDVARSANMLAGDGMEAIVANVVEEFVILFQVTIEQIKSEDGIAAGDRVKQMASLSDAFNKMVASAGRVAPKISELGVANDVLHRLAEFVQANYPQHGTAFLEILEPFGEHLAEVYG